MTDRIRTELPLRCDCGAQGMAVFEKDDIAPPSDQAQNLSWTITGPFIHRNSRFVCSEWEKRNA